MTEPTPQDFWLAHLDQAGRFNRWVLDQFAQHLGPSVLEVGCGTGNFTTLIAARGHRIAAVDINPAYVETTAQRLAAVPGARVWQADATQSEWDEPFDTVILLDVLEHIEDDVGFLGRLHRAVKPGGSLILKVPAGEWLYSPMDEAIGHFRRYTRKTLSETMEKAGFHAEEHRFFNRFGVLGWWLNGRLLKRVKPPGEQVRLFEKLVPAFQFLEGMAPVPFGLSLISCARRPA